jgi:DNA repair protein RecN (Recombination protein N)
MGQRADFSLLKNKEKKCVVEGVFKIKNYNLEDFFKLNDLDYSDELIVRREISPNGNSRSFVNDTPVTLNLLKELGVQLVDIHSQHENLLLADGKFQLAVLDGLSDDNKLLEKYTSHFSEFGILLKKLMLLKSDYDKNKSDSDYFNFQLSQLDEAGLTENEQEELELEKEMLAHAGEILEGLGRAVQIISDEENSLIDKVKELKIILENISRKYSAAESWKDRIDNSLIEIKDIASDISSTLTKVEANPNRLNIVYERLDLIYSLQQKHKVNTISELIAIREEYRTKLYSVEKLDEQIVVLNKEISEKEKVLKQLTGKLSDNRKKAAVKLEKNIVPQLKELGILNASFKIDFIELPEYSSSGKDAVKFMFSANKKVEPMEISKVASGGELSRVMLSIKSFVTETNNVRTIIFDEIDAGVSGEIAHKMSEIMQHMSSNLQVISITHLPQIASRGAHHYLVYKDNSGESSTTRIKQLESKERITEIAKMLSGKEISAAALENAKNLLKN